MDVYSMTKSSYDPLCVTFRTDRCLKRYLRSLGDDDLRAEVRILEEYYAFAYRKLRVLVDRVWIEAARLDAALRIEDSEFGDKELSDIVSALKDIGHGASAAMPEIAKGGKPSRTFDVSDLRSIPREKLLTLALRTHSRIEKRSRDGAFGGIYWSFRLLIEGLAKRLPVREEDEEALVFARRLELHLFRVLAEVENEATSFSVRPFSDFIAALDAVDSLRERWKAQVRLAVFESEFPYNILEELSRLWRQLRRERKAACLRIEERKA